MCGPKMLRTAPSTRRSQICTVLSQPADSTMFSSSGWNFTEKTRLEWPGVCLPMPRDSVEMIDLVASSYSRTL